MTQLADGSFRFLPAEIAELPWLGQGDDVMKVLHVDKAMGQVVFVQRFGRGSKHLRHTHHCTAFAFTLDGTWAYDDGAFPTGTVAFEPYGSTHQAMAPAAETAEVLVVLTGGPGNPRLLELEAPEGKSLELDLAAFERLKAMRSGDQWAPFMAELLGNGEAQSR